MKRLVLLGSLQLAALCAAPRAQVPEPDPAPVLGRVVDAAGQPAAGVQVAHFWSLSEGAPTPFDAATTAADGSFSIALRSLPGMLLAYSADGALAGSAVAQAAGDRVEIALLPAVRVRGSLVSPELARPIPWTNVYVWSADRTHRPVQCSSREAIFDVLLPPGRYLLWAYGQDVGNAWKRLEVGGDQKEIALGDIELPATFLALMRGKPLPEWHVTDARNAVNELPELADYRGKYLLVEAWGFW